MSEAAGIAQPIRAALDATTARLAAAELPSPRADADTLLAWALGIDTAELARRTILGQAVTPDDLLRLEAALARREQHEPVQHITGSAGFIGRELAVGPGVFIPRAETEGVAEFARAQWARRGPQKPARIVDLGTGSGALALAMHWDFPRAEITAIEADPDAATWARRNLERYGNGQIRLILGEIGTPQLRTELRGLLGAVDLVVTNPPYIPSGVQLPREVGEHDPAHALYGGGVDGLAAPLAFAACAAALLRPGGLLVMEHDDSQGESLPQLLATKRQFGGFVAMRDLNDRPRALAATRL